MKNVIYVLLLILLTTFSGCGIPESEHNKVKSERDSLTLVVAELEKEIDELKNGETRIIGLIENSYDANKFIDAKNHIELLFSKHPESQKRQHYSNLLPTIEEKAKEELAVIEKQKKDSIRLANINNLGIWKIQYFVDDFGEPTKEGYITTENPIYGTFSNSATQNSDLRVHFIIAGEKSVAIKLFEYNSNNPVKGYKDSYRVLVQDSNGERHTLSASNWDSDRLSFSSYAYKDKSDAEKMFDILLKGGEIKFKIVDSDRSTTEYNFIVSNADWFENAYIKLTLKQ
jgi:hypothetical protein